MVEQKDITAYMDSLGINQIAEEKRRQFVDSVENVMLKEIEAKDSTLRIEIKPFYEGNQFFLTTYRDYKDVRLVFALPKSIRTFAWCSPCPNQWVSLAVRRTTGCGLARPATSLCSVSM